MSNNWQNAARDPHTTRGKPIQIASVPRAVSVHLHDRCKLILLVIKITLNKHHKFDIICTVHRDKFV